MPSGPHRVSPAVAHYRLRISTLRLSWQWARFSAYKARQETRAIGMNAQKLRLSVNGCARASPRAAIAGHLTDGQKSNATFTVAGPPFSISETVCLSSGICHQWTHLRGKVPPMRRLYHIAQKNASPPFSFGSRISRNVICLRTLPIDIAYGRAVYLDRGEGKRKERGDAPHNTQSKRASKNKQTGESK